ncbi:hypothetical protein [Aestuariibacter sp. A3R04]|uniref:hypothetical protein n=1 Tax=Aestuariibacter sp. A3R04 TaxID=2841571 RepID=UPI001C0A3E6F|nr:hypothetical protein [Aestuariibacter sp. A3R04]MBU3023790.1 hypothetical protein [Aestuariibacter sp. A3R04]
MENTTKITNAKPFAWIKRALFNPTSELIVLTLLFGSLTFYVFWLTIYWQLLPTELVSPFLSQEDTGLFDALGGWALGFAGALVAIRIAGVAAQIQENDSVSAHVKAMEAEVTLISEYNSALIRAISDARRACSAVLLFAKDLSIQQTERENQHLYNPSPFIRKRNISPNKSREAIPEVGSDHLAQTIKQCFQDFTYHAFEDKEQMLQTTLEARLDHLVQTIERCFQNSTYRSVIVEQKTSNGQAKNQKKSFIESIFEELANNDAPSGKDTPSEQEDRPNDKTPYSDKLIDILHLDTQFFDILNIVDGFGSGNFGIGLMELRSLDLIEHYRKDLMFLLDKENEQFDSKPPENNETKIAELKKRFQIPDASWLFLGMLLYRYKLENSGVTYNSGIVSLSLILGSLPTEDSVKARLKAKKEAIEKPYSRQGKQVLENEIEAMTKRVYYLRSADLSDLTHLMKACCAKPDYLTVLTASKGVSEEATSTLPRQDAERGKEGGASGRPQDSASESKTPNNDMEKSYGKSDLKDN